jgi:hypothetical protein
VAYFPKRDTPAECNYDIYDKGLLAIIKAHEEWRPEYERDAYPFQLITDLKLFEYFMARRC